MYRLVVRFFDCVTEWNSTDVPTLSSVLTYSRLSMYYSEERADETE